MEKAVSKEFYKNSVVYKIYPMSFCDSDGDGIGDLSGITEKLPYLSALGADVIALCSVFETNHPSASYGTTDFCRINPAIGTMDDFIHLVESAHASGMKVILSMTMVCTSSAHAWFEKIGIPDEGNRYKEYYIFKRGKDSKGKTPPDASKNLIGGSAWAYDRGQDEWYADSFGDEFPTLNYDNPRLRHEFHDIFRFWQGKGVDGFLIDNAHFSAENDRTDRALPHAKGTEFLFDQGSLLYRMLTDLREKSENDLHIVLDAVKTSPKLYSHLISEENPLCDSLCAEYVISSTRLGEKAPFTVRKFIKDYLDLQSIATTQPLSFALEGNEHKRLLSCLPEYTDAVVPAATLLATLLLTSAATPILYQGEEIGMTDRVASKRAKKEEIVHSPFQWDNKPNAAFTDGYPYLPVDPAYHVFNAAAEAKDPNSILNYYKNMISYRKSSEAILFGDFHDYSSDNTIAFTRSVDRQRLFIVANLSDRHIRYTLPDELSKASLQCDICNYPLVSKSIYGALGLRPFEVRILRLKETPLGID